MGRGYYNPSIGRFITPDWIVPNPTDSQAYNRYSYVTNNPINLIDPTGNTGIQLSDSQLDNIGFTSLSDIGSFSNFTPSQSLGDGLNSFPEAFTYTNDQTGSLSSNSPFSSSFSNADAIGLAQATNCGGSCPSITPREMSSFDQISLGLGFLKAPQLAQKAIVASRVIRFEQQLLSAASQPFKNSGFSVAGRALTKHPNIIGQGSPQNLLKFFGNDKLQINQAASNAVSSLIRNGAREVKNTKSFGKVLEFKMSNGLGVRFNAKTKDFIGFLGRGVK